MGATKCDLVDYCIENNRGVYEVPDDLVGADECTWGPSYWCSDRQNAIDCGTEQHCLDNAMGWAQTTVEPPTKGEPILGADECTWGPSHWCSSEDVATKCDMVDHCIENNLGVYEVPDVLVGADECTWGPSYWCSDRQNAIDCGTEQHCLDNNMGWAQPTTVEVVEELAEEEDPISGADECTWGPSHWCSSEEVATKCELVDYCIENNQGVYQVPDELVGADECTWGPSHWCSERQVAIICNAEQHCLGNNLGWAQTTISPSTEAHFLGADECTWGTTHWCSDFKVAKKCYKQNFCRNEKIGVYKVCNNDIKEICQRMKTAQICGVI